ncbi:N-alpha-acetyltransferase 20 isoform X2 [Passer montanus]|uniref:N-alpha-acetyltransferase 20 isoform X2 n=1 Tax=Passer montanus TaxID=9160 RepID=UPI00195FFED2|nr:N-alpha-acetyltransferase 20 isoform X2 [Passer montanus]
MTTLRAFTCDDLFRFNNINLDPLTETYGIPFYLQYLAHWPEYFIVAEAPGGELMGYSECRVFRRTHGHSFHFDLPSAARSLGCGNIHTYLVNGYFFMGKAEGSVAREEWHGHVTALSVAPEFRRLGLAAKLMELLEEISEKYEKSSFQRYRKEISYTSASSCETRRHRVTLSCGSHAIY